LSALGFNVESDALIHQPAWLTAGGAALTAVGLGWFHRVAGYPAPVEDPPLLTPIPAAVQPPASPAS
jgi:hypothetical protein